MFKNCLPLLIEEGNVDADPEEHKFISSLTGHRIEGGKESDFEKPEVEVWMASWQCLHLVVQLLGVAFSFQSSHQFVHLGKTFSKVCPFSAAGADVVLRHSI